MAIASWNDAEDEALDYLPHMDQVIYLRGIRRRMDYQTGIAGVTAPISYAWLAQLVEVRPRRGSHMRVPGRPTKEQLRAVFRRLEHAGLIEWIRDHGGKGLIFRCLLADTDQSVPRRNNPRTTPEQPQMSYPMNTPDNSNNDNDLHEQSNPTNNLRTTPGHPLRSNPIPVSGIRKDILRTDVRSRRRLRDDCQILPLEDQAELGTREDAIEAPQREQIPYSQIVEIYHETLPELPRVLKLTDTRRRHIRARWVSGDLPTLDDWREYFSTVRQSRFLMGLTQGRNGQRPFRADFDWLIREGNVVKVCEGRYSDSTAKRASG